jgi:hypothetical protein
VAYTYQELHGKTLEQLREIAKGAANQNAVKGYSQMNKQHLLPALCRAMGIDSHEHHATAGIDKPAIKAQMRELRKQRDLALEAHDREKLKSIRRHLHSLNRQIRDHVSP